MKQSILFLVILISFGSTAQKFEIPTKKYPFYDIIEWKGMGAILMSKDPNNITRQINLTLIGNKQTSIWDQKFIPKTEEFYYLSSENARYVYFLDNLELTNGKVYFNQLNSAGNIKGNSVSIGSAIKKLGNYDYNNLEVINVVVTDKALVHHLRYVDKKEKCVREFATFITHHNFLCYAVEVGSVSNENLKNSELYGQWKYIGFTGDQIYFALRDYQSKKKGWSIKEYTSKGKAKLGTFINAPEDLISIENIGFGTTGEYYLEDKKTVETGLISQINGKLYMIGAQKRDNGATLILFKNKEGEWVEVNTMNLNYFIEKKTLKLGIYPVNEGLGYHLDHNGYNKVSLISFTPNETSSHNDFTDRTIYNPSSVLERQKTAEFTVDLPEAVLVFDTNQLADGMKVEFELIAK